jgi:hypothetical protein
MDITLPLDQMTVEEKLRAMEALWADLCRREKAVPVPQWHKDLLDERERLVEQGNAQFIDWETAKKRISERTSSVREETVFIRAVVDCRGDPASIRERLQ